MSKLDAVKRYIAATEGLKRLEMLPREIEELRKESLLAPGAALVIDGIPVEPVTPRMQLLAERGLAYAGIRYHVLLTYTDIESLFKAVPTEELEALIPIIIDQHLDDLGYPDPLDDMDHADVEDLKKRLKEAGFVDVEI